LKNRKAIFRVPVARLRSAIMGFRHSRTLVAALRDAAAPARDIRSTAE
jgi:hypothetical protein